MIKSLLIFFLLPWLGLSCPDNCRCEPEGRGQSVECSGGELPTILGALPHNTARLKLDSLASLHALGKAGVEGAATRSILKLAITNSALQIIEPDVFKTTLTGLQELDLSRNSIKDIQPGAFSGLSSLHTLNLSSNNIRTLGVFLEPLVSLKRLDLGHNHINTLTPGSFQSQSSLTDLRLDGNHLRELSGSAFEPIQFLTNLQVRGCHIYKINTNFFESVKKIKHLDFGENNLNTFPTSMSFADLKHFRNLYLDANSLRTLQPHQFHGLSLVTLSLARNELTSISGDVLDGLMVEKLDLSENKLLELQRQTLEPIAPHLKVLNIAHNSLMDIKADTFDSLQSLKTLNVSGCSLQYLPMGVVSSLHALRTLDASWNHLRNISQGLVKIFKRLGEIRLHNNSWRCDCHIVPFRDWLRSLKAECPPGQHSYSPACSDLKCMGPDSLIGQRVIQLDDSHVRACGESGPKDGLPVPIQISIVLACLLFSLGMLLVTLYLWRRGRTRKELKHFFVKRPKRDSHDEEDEEESQKITPFVDGDNESLKESHRSFVFRHYFDEMVTDPTLLEPTSPSQVGPTVRFQNDSVYSSNPSLYEASKYSSSNVVVGIESTV